MNDSNCIEVRRKIEWMGVSYTHIRSVDNTTSFVDFFFLFLSILNEI